MLDERLLGLTFTLQDDSPTGTISFFGVLYHYHVDGPVVPGELVVVTAITPLYLVVTAQHNQLDY